MDAYIVNIIGLVFDIAGVIGLFMYGIPKEISKSGSINLILEQEDEGEKEEWNKYDKRSKIALSLIIIGFTLQIVSSVLFLLPIESCHY